MNRGGWVPISKGLARALPRDRAFTELEAAFSLQLDYDGDHGATLSGYASLWRWSKDKVRRFLAELGVEIEYRDDTKKRQNQRGYLKPSDNRLIIDRKPSDNRLINFIDSKWLEPSPDRKPSDNRLKIDRKSYATKDPKSLNQKPLCGFDDFWRQYPRKAGKQPALKEWHKANPDDAMTETILSALEKHKRTDQWQRDQGRFIPHPSTWLRQRRWEDDVETAEEIDDIPAHAQAAEDVARRYGL